jgi:hypothetical protein
MVITPAGRRSIRKQGLRRRGKKQRRTTMNKIALMTTAGVLAAVIVGIWSYASIKADATAIAAGVFAPISIDVMQLTHDAKPMPSEQFAAF